MVCLATIHVLLAWRSRLAFHGRLTEADEAVAYSWRPRAFILGVVVLWVVVLITTGALGAHSESMFESLPLNALVLLALAMPIWGLSVEFFGTEYHVTPTGLRKHSPWTRNFDVRWDELETAKWQQGSGWLVIRTTHGKIRIHELIRGRWKVTAALEAQGLEVKTGF